MKDKVTSLNTEINLLRTSQTFISNKRDNLAVEYDDIVRNNKKQKQEIKQLTRQTETLQKLSCADQFRIDDLEDYGRRQNLELLGVDIREDDISIAHRHPQRKRPGRMRIDKPNIHPTIMVRLVSRQKRNQIYANRLKAKDITKFPVEGMEKFYVNENLTQRRNDYSALPRER